MRLPSIDEKVNFEDYPHIDHAGRQFIKEAEFQIFENDTWNDAERAWWNALRLEVLQMILSYEDAIHAAFRRGVEYGNRAAYDDNEDYENRL